MENKVGIMRITYQLMEKLFNIPEDHKIVDIISASEDRTNNQIRLKIIGPTMPLQREGDVVTYIANIPG